ncbi:sigma-70 family RNA polymerase sigma factor [Leucothrix sargassi]|nr:sigma-70 family RNA polymerase sigma factor [Leucothrix sargassi]
MADLIEIESLIAQAALNNQKAFNDLYNATSVKLYSVCFSILNNQAQAEEAMQDAFIKIWRNANRYQTNGLSPMTWLITIARNTAIDKLRAQGTNSHTSEALDHLEDTRPSPEAASIADSEKTQIALCLQQLEEDKAAAVRGAYLQGSSYADLAKQYQVPINTMRTWLRRSLLKLKGCLSNG